MNRQQMLDLFNQDLAQCGMKIILNEDGKPSFIELEEKSTTKEKHHG